MSAATPLDYAGRCERYARQAGWAYDPHRISIDKLTPRQHRRALHKERRASPNHHGTPRRRYATPAAAHARHLARRAAKRALAEMDRYAAAYLDDDDGHLRGNIWPVDRPCYGDTFAY